MTVEEYVAAMLDAKGEGTEDGHVKADDLLCTMIREHLPAFAPVVDAYESIGKWYA